MRGAAKIGQLKRLRDARLRAARGALAAAMADQRARETTAETAREHCRAAETAARGYVAARLAEMGDAPVSDGAATFGSIAVGAGLARRRAAGAATAVEMAEMRLAKAVAARREAARSLVASTAALDAVTRVESRLRDAEAGRAERREEDRAAEGRPAPRRAEIDGGPDGTS